MNAKKESGKSAETNNIIKKIGYLRWRVIIGLPSKPGPTSPGHQNNAIAISVRNIGGSSDVLWDNDEVDRGNVEDEGAVTGPTARVK